MLTIGPWQILLPLVALNLMKKKEIKYFIQKKYIYNNLILKN